MTQEQEIVRKIIRERRSIFPHAYNDEPIPDHIILDVLEAGNWAPTHRLTEPWRYTVIRGEGLNRLSKFLGDAYKAGVSEDAFSEMKFKKTVQKPLKCACIIAICMQRDPDLSIPEWEEIASMAMSVQNMWLTCAAHNIGCYWSSPKSMVGNPSFLNLPEGQQCYGLFYMGYTDQELTEGKRTAMGDKVNWVDA